MNKSIKILNLSKMIAFAGKNFLHFENLCRNSCKAGFIIFISIFLLYLGCDVAPTISQSPITNPGNPGDPGTLLLQVKGTYPDTSESDIPVDVDIVIIFTKPVNTSTIPGNVTVSGVALNSGDFIFSADDRIVTIDVGTLAFLTSYTITVGTGAQASDGNALDEVYTSSFETGTNTSADYDPRVIAASRYPTTLDNPVSIDIGYIYVTFTKPIDAASVVPASFSISPDEASGAPARVGLTNTYQLPLNTLSYGTLPPSHTVTLTTAIRDTDSNPLVPDGNESWSFTTEQDPDVGPGTNSITSVWVNDIAAGTATVRFATSYPVPSGDNITVDFGTTTSYAEPAVPVGGGDNSVHAITINPPTQGTKYYFQIAIPGYTTLTVDPQNPTVNLSFLSFGPSTANPANTDITNNNNVKTERALLQSTNITNTPIYDGSSYLVWKEGNNLYGHYITSTGTLGGGTWPDPIDTNNRTNVRIFSDGLGGVIATLEDGANGFYTKRYYDNTGITFDADWAANAGAAGLSFGHTAGYTKPWAQYVYTGAIANNVYPGFVTKITPAPTDLLPNTTEMPGEGSNQLIFDYDVNFNSIAALTTGDYILTEDQISYNNSTFISDTTTLTRPTYVTDYFNYSVIENTDYSSIGDFYILLDSGVNYTADDGTNGATIGTTIYTLNDMSVFSNGDIIENNDTGLDDGKYTYITNIALNTPIAGVDRVIIAHNIGLTDTENFIVHQRLEGQIAGTYGTQRTVRAYTRPLWDNNAVPDFTSVNLNDWVLNETAGSISAAQVATKYGITGALELSGLVDIMNDNNNYWIVRLANAAEPIVAFGKRDNAATNLLTDTDAHYGNILNAGVGDLVYNVRLNRYAAVIADGGTTLTLSRPIAALAADTDAYMIFNSDEPLVDAGRCTSDGSPQLYDLNASFISSGVTEGDLVYESDGTYIGMIISIDSNTQLTLNTGSTSLDQDYFIVEPRVMFAWQDEITNNILGALIRMKSGTTYSTFPICTAIGTQQNVRLVSDGQGGAFAIYESSNGRIYGKSINGIGTVTGGAAAIGVVLDAGAGTILDVKSDNNNGIYLLYDNGANIVLTRRNAALGNVWTNTIIANTYDAVFTVDTTGRPLIAYSDVNDDIYIQRRALAGGASEYNYEICSPLSSYVSGLSIAPDLNNGAIIGWIDSRYYAQNGYMVFAQAVDGTGARLWDADANPAATDWDGIRIGTTSTYDPSDLALWSAFYNDTALPWGGVFMWFDYRFNTNGDLYFSTRNNP